MATAAQSMRGDSICAFCARMKRGTLYTCCRAHGYTTLVLAQHADDLAESFLMSAFHNGAQTRDTRDFGCPDPWERGLFLSLFQRPLKALARGAACTV